jgi:hypothetical protein
MTYSYGKVPQATPVHHTRSISANGGSVLLQQPRHKLIYPRFRLDENILRLDLPYILLAKLDSGKFMWWLRLGLCIVKRGRLVFSSPPAIRALYGKFSRQTPGALHRNFARARRTAYAAHSRVGSDNFLKHCHGGLLSGFRGLLCGSRCRTGIDLKSANAGFSRRAKPAS